MLYLLQDHPLKDEELLADYNDHYGEAIRLAELEQAGLASKVGNQVLLTTKGKTLVALLSALR